MLKGFEDVELLGGAQDGAYAYVEAMSYRDVNGATRYDLKAEALPENELEDWTWQKGRYPPCPTSKSLGGIRILFAQATSGFVPGIPSALKKARVLDALHLPKCSFHSFQQAQGVFSMHTKPDHVAGNACPRLGLLFRTPQKWECSIGMFAVSYTFDTGITTALSLGYAFDLDKFETEPPARFASFVDQIEERRAYWSHPMMLPCIFLVTHALRVEYYLRDTIGPQVLAIKDCIGVTKAGAYQREWFGIPGNEEDVSRRKLFVGGKLHRENAKRLTESINDLSTWTNFAKRSPQWNIQCADFVLNLIDSDQRLRDRDGLSVEPFHEALHYVRNHGEAWLEDAENAAAQMQLQLNILYTSIAQDDGQTSARIAASAGKDSTSMKIIALITAAYLPGTFIATMFSMNMFSWRSSDADHSISRASPDLWIYWAITVPLTIITLAGWAMWWKYEMSRFDRDVQIAFQDSATRRPSPASNSSKLPFISV